MNTKLKSTVITSVAALTFGAQSQASITDSSFQRDMDRAFEHDGLPRHLSQLSEQEMRDTQGAIWPFVGNWGSRFFWGGSFGSFLNGVAISTGYYPAELRTMYQIMGWNILAHSIVGLMNTHPAIGFFGSVGVVTVPIIRKEMQERNWNIHDLIDHTSSAVADHTAEALRGLTGNNGGPEPMSAQRRENMDAEAFLASLIREFPQDRLRHFLSTIPRRTFDRVLSDVSPGMSRNEFLRSLPPEVVNKVLTIIPDEHTSEFAKIVPKHLMQRLSTAASYQQSRGYLPARDHWRH